MTPEQRCVWRQWRAWRQLGQALYGEDDPRVVVLGDSPTSAVRQENGGRMSNEVVCPCCQSEVTREPKPGSSRYARECVRCGHDWSPVLPHREDAGEDEKLLREIENDFRSTHHFAGSADHPAMKDRIDRDVEGTLEPIREHLRSLRHRIAELERIMGTRREKP